MAFGIFRPATNILEECYELLYLVSTACEAGVMALVNSGGLRVIAPQMSDLPDGNMFIPSLCIVVYIAHWISVNALCVSNQFLDKD